MTLIRILKNEETISGDMLLRSFHKTRSEARRRQGASASQRSQQNMVLKQPMPASQNAIFSDPQARYPMDYILLWLVLLLTLIGLISILSASAHVAQAQIGDASFYFKKQLVGICIGLVGLLLALRINVYHLPLWVKPLMAVTIILLIFTHIPGLGLTINGSSRWLDMPGFRLQPSEIAKPVLILYLATILGNHQFSHLSLKDKGFTLLPIIAIMALILRQPDLGTTIVLGLTMMVVYFAAGTPYWKILGVIGSGLLAFGLLSWSTPYQQARITSWLDPWSDPQGSGFHLIQSLIAIGSGGAVGTGFGQSVQKLFYLPEQHTDFIFAVIAEEFGFVGICVLLLIFMGLTQRGVTIACKSPTPYLKLLAIGLACMISLQAFVNMAVVSGAIPTTGLTLPFISYGSSSVAVNLTAMGLLLNISRYFPNKQAATPTRKTT